MGVTAVTQQTHQRDYKETAWVGMCSGWLCPSQQEGVNLNNYVGRLFCGVC